MSWTCAVWDHATGWWTPGWGNLFTVTVAAAGIALSAWYNRRTLQSSNDKFQQQRRDERNDKLRVEIAAFVTEIEQCRMQTRKLGNRLNELSLKARNEYDAAADEAAKKSVVDEYQTSGQGAVVELVWDLYTRVAVRGMTIMMLTTDNQILEPMMKIQSLIDEDRRDFEVLVMAREFRDLVNERGRTMLERHESRQDDVFELTKTLGAYCAVTFRQLD